MLLMRSDGSNDQTTAVMAASYYPINLSSTSKVEVSDGGGSVDCCSLSQRNELVFICMCGVR
jgi:hypothetical protein